MREGSGVAQKRSSCVPGLASLADSRCDCWSVDNQSSGGRRGHDSAPPTRDGLDSRRPTNGHTQSSSRRHAMARATRAFHPTRRHLVLTTRALSAHRSGSSRPSTNRDPECSARCRTHLAPQACSTPSILTSTWTATHESRAAKRVRVQSPGGCDMRTRLVGPARDSPSLHDRRPTRATRPSRGLPCLRQRSPQTS
jgi:hypothetical protein